MKRGLVLTAILTVSGLASSVVLGQHGMQLLRGGLTGTDALRRLCHLKVS